MQKILVTGFEPFGGHRANPSEQVVQRLAPLGLEGINLFTAVLPVDRSLSTRALLQAYRQAAPDVVLCLGEAAGRTGLSVERLGVNLADYRIPDNAGNQVVDQPLVPGGPAAYFATLPVRQIVDAILSSGIPAELSLSAGAYLCNQVLYTILHTIASEGTPVRAGFVHLPALPADAASEKKSLPSMSVETALAGVLKALEVIRDTSSSA